MRAELTDLLSIDRSSPVSLEAQMSRQITVLIASGRLKPGDRLPTMADIASSLGVNERTARAAYRRLRDQGLVDSRRGHGTTVVSDGLVQVGADRRDPRSFTIGLIVPGLIPFYAPVLWGARAALEDDPSQVLVVDAGDDPESALRSLRQLVARDVDGVVVVSQRFDDPEKLLHDDLPPMVFGDWPDAPGSAVTFAFDAMDDAVRHLMTDGHSEIGFVAPQPIADGTSLASMVAAFERAIDRAGLPSEGSIIEVPSWEYSAGEDVAGLVASGALGRTALVTASEHLAIGLLTGLAARSLTVPDDIAVVAVGPTTTAPLLDPPLSTIDLPAFELGRALMTEMVGRIAGNPPAARSTLSSSFTIRRSCARH